MAEKRTTASEVLERLRNRELSPRQLARMYPRVPDLRLRADTPTLDVTEATAVGDALKELQAQGIGTMALREQGAGPTAVVLSVERYLELVGTQLIRDEYSKIMRVDHVVVPTDEAFAALHVEPVNPNDTWQIPF
jgi:hypothetical protein